MDITHLGHSCFKIKTKTATVITDPYDPKMVGKTYPKQEADFVTVSHQHADHNFLERISGYRKVLDGPGEYEISEVSVLGIGSYHDAKEGAEKGNSTIYVFEAEGLRVAHLGDLGHKLTAKQIEEIGDLDILMVPVGGTYTIGPDQAAEVVRQLSPTLVIPMHYLQIDMNQQQFGMLKPVEDFLKVLGMTVEKMDKLSVKADTLEETEKIILLP